MPAATSAGGSRYGIEQNQQAYISNGFSARTDVRGDVVKTFSRTPSYDYDTLYCRCVALTLARRLRFINYS